MKIMSSFVALLMMIVLPTTFAHADKITLNDAIANLNFTLNVKWDQKDQAVRTEALKVFSNQIEELKAQGMTQDQIIGPEITVKR